MNQIKDEMVFDEVGVKAKIAYRGDRSGKSDW